MDRAHWHAESGSVRLRARSGADLLPTADEIFSAEFGGARLIQGEPVASPSADIPGLRFSRFPATPVYRVFEADGSLRLEIGLTTGGTDYQRLPGTNLDQAIIGGAWYPLQTPVLAAVREWIAGLGVSEGSPLSLGCLIALRTRGDRPAPLVDQVTSTSASLGARTAELASSVDGIRGQLYPYQSVGVAFLQLVADQGIGCVLGDAMGLGKTLQIIALLQAERNARRGPSLVIAPATLLENWRRELGTFAPQLDVYVHAGPARAGVAARLAVRDVTVVSYETAVRDEPLLADVRWNVIALDEAQNIKNPDAQRTLSVKRLQRRVSIAVTGTPLENSLDDLWSITDFALPGLLGSIADFRSEFHNDAADAARVGTLVAPVLLRRTVEEVASDLPERIDVPQRLVMTRRLAEEYERVRQESLTRYGPAGGLVAVTQLRVCCAHPCLNGDWPGDPADDMPKYQRLLEILEEVFSSGEKALIFSTYQGMADLMSADLSARFASGFFRKIDGRVPVEQRQTTVDAFFGHAGFGALLLNPKAAGTGLNITAANHVIHYNPEWNPALTDQATARAYRRKQQRPVTVHYLYFLDTVEEVMMDRAGFKRLLAGEAVLGHQGEVDAQELARALEISPLRSGGHE